MGLKCHLKWYGCANVLWIKLSLSEQSFMWPTQKQSSQFQMISHNHECKLYIHIICNSSMSIISLIEDDQQLVKVKPSRSINSIQRKLEAHLSLRSYALINVGCSALDNCKREYYLRGEHYLVWSTFLKIKYESGGGAKYFRLVKCNSAWFDKIDSSFWQTAFQ